MLHDVIGASRFDELMIKMGCTSFEMDIFCKINVTALEKNKFFTLVFNKCPRFLGNE